MKEVFKTLLFDEDYDIVSACLPENKRFEEYSDFEKSSIAIFLIIYLRYKAKDAIKNESILGIIEILANKYFINHCIKLIEKNFDKLEITSTNDIFIKVSDKIIILVNSLILGPFYLPKKLQIDNLKVKNFSHPQDEWYLSKLRKTVGFDKVVQFILKHSFERIYRVQYTGSNLKINEHMLPDKYVLFKFACEQLSLEIAPELYTQQGFINACTIGDSKPIVIVDSGSFSLLNKDELLFLIGHELGHIKARHCLYHMMAQILPIISDQAQYFTLGLSGIITIGLNLALLQWQRMSEFTADRAGLLCCQNIEAACSVLMKLSGLPTSDYHKADVKAFINQAKQFEEFDNDTVDKILKFASILGETHPWTIMRAKELLTWYDSKGYQDLLVTKNCEEG